VEDLSLLSGEELHSPKTYLVFFNGTILGVHRRPNVFIHLTFSHLSFWDRRLVMSDSGVFQYSNLNHYHDAHQSIYVSDLVFVAPAICRGFEETAPGWQDWRICERAREP